MIWKTHQWQLFGFQSSEMFQMGTVIENVPIVERNNVPFSSNFLGASGLSSELSDASSEYMCSWGLSLDTRAWSFPKLLLSSAAGVAMVIVARILLPSLAAQESSSEGQVVLDSAKIKNDTPTASAGLTTTQCRLELRHGIIQCNDWKPGTWNLYIILF